jgi:aspartyl/asparaginyl beta-hydroxylase (cupin superfamily)
MNDIHYVLIGVLIILVIVSIWSMVINRKDSKEDSKEDKDSEEGELLDQRFYDVNDVYPELNKILDNLGKIKNEIRGNLEIKENDNDWKDWPERNLYATNRKWKIVPFKAFDVTVEENCKKYPHLWKFISSVPNVRVAILSKLSPGMKLTPHQGWGMHSNYVLRCHFGLDVPKEKACYISVADVEGVDEEIQYHSQDNWMIFDDAKFHYAENPTELDRIVLIMDLDRPKNVKEGASKVGDTKELLEIVNSFRNT